MLTATDIPPGGEGQIKVTFDTSHKEGQQNKTIMVESNDPQNPRASLRVSAFVEIVFGFERYSLDLGRIRKGQPAAKAATLFVKDPSIINTIEFTSSSPYIKANLLNIPVSSDSAGRLTVEVSGAPDIPAGRINAKITARADDSAASEATLQVVGTVIGKIDVSPDIVQFHVDTTRNESRPARQIVRVDGAVEEAQFEFLGVKDAQQLFAFSVDTLVAGRRYEISMTPQPAVLSARQNVSGTVIITTDDEEQPTISVTYSIVYGR